MAGYQPNPIAQDAYSRFMADMYDERQIIAVQTVFQQFFGRPEYGGRTYYSPDAAAVDIDIIRGTDLTAALVPRGTVTRPLGGTQRNAISQRYSSFSRSFPLVEEESDFEATQLLRRMAGEPSYGGMTQSDRLRSFAIDEHQEHIRRVVRLDEILAGISLRTGFMPAILGTVDPDLTYDFRRLGTHTYAAPAVWTNAATDILTQWDTAWALINRDGKCNMDMVFIGGTAVPGIFNNTAIRALLDNRRIEIGLVSNGQTVPASMQRFVDAGATCLGYLTTTRGHRVWMFTYDGTYTNAAGAVVNYMPLTEAFYACSTARCDRYFGPNERMPLGSAERQWYQETFGFSMAGPNMPGRISGSNIIVPESFYFDAYPSSDRKRVTLRTQQAPIYVPTQTDAFVLATAVA